MKKITFMNPINIEYENLYKVNQPFVNEFEKVFSEVLNSGWFILGKNVEAFEKEFAAYNKSKYCVGLASGLDALTLSLKALNLEQGAEVIVPSNTYIASILAIIHAGLKPVLVEPDITTYNITARNIQKSLTIKTKAVMVVHLYGKPCQMDAITNICKENNLYLIEDCAQAHGANYKGKKVGTFGDFGAFSFYPTKNLGALGDGGAIITNNEELSNKIKELRNYGFKKKYVSNSVGYNSRLDEVQAAFLRIKLKSLEKINKHKQELAKIYFEHLNDQYIVPVLEENSIDVFHIFNVRHSKRDALKDHLIQNGIKTEVHYPVAPNKQKALAFLSLREYPIAEQIHKTTLSLPISFSHSKENIELVADTMNAFIK